MNDTSILHNQTGGGSTIPDRDHPFPGAVNRKIKVPEEMINAGTPTNLPRVDSPDSLDAVSNVDSDI